MIKLKNQVSIIVPKTNNEGEDTTKVINKINNLFCNSFGGTSIYGVHGSWVDGGEVYYDDNVEIVSNTNTFNIYVLAQAVEAVLNDAKQLAASLKINNQLYIFEKGDNVKNELLDLFEVIQVA